MKSNVSRYAKVDPGHILDGLFVPKRKQGEALCKVEAPFDRGLISFKGVQLSVPHQSVLLAIAARTGRQGKCDGLIVRGTGDDLEGRQMDLLSITGPATDLDVSRVECTAYALLSDAGMGDRSSDYAILRDLLHEMSTVVMYRSKDGVGGTSKLLSFQNHNDKFLVSLNWRMTDAIFGGQNVQVSLHERHKLKGPVAKVLHTWLSAYVRKGGSLMAGRGAGLDTLLGHVYGKRPCSDSAHRNRRGYIRDALAEIGELRGWGVEHDGGQVYVSRSREREAFEDFLPSDLDELDRMTFD